MVSLMARYAGAQRHLSALEAIIRTLPTLQAAEGLEHLAHLKAELKINKQAIHRRNITIMNNNLPLPLDTESRRRLIGGHLARKRKYAEIEDNSVVQNSSGPATSTFYSPKRTRLNIASSTIEEEILMKPATSFAPIRGHKGKISRLATSKFIKSVRSSATAWTVTGFSASYQPLSGVGLPSHPPAVFGKAAQSFVPPSQSALLFGKPAQPFGFGHSRFIQPTPAKANTNASTPSGLKETTIDQETPEEPIEPQVSATDSSVKRRPDRPLKRPAEAEPAGSPPSKRRKTGHSATEAKVVSEATAGDNNPSADAIGSNIALPGNSPPLTSDPLTPASPPTTTPDLATASSRKATSTVAVKSLADVITNSTSISSPRTRLRSSLKRKNSSFMGYMRKTARFTADTPEFSPPRRGPYNPPKREIFDTHKVFKHREPGHVCESGYSLDRNSLEPASSPVAPVSGLAKPYDREALEFEAERERMRKAYAYTVSNEEEESEKERKNDKEEKAEEEMAPCEPFKNTDGLDYLFEDDEASIDDSFEAKSQGKPTSNHCAPSVVGEEVEDTEEEHRPKEKKPASYSSNFSQYGSNGLHSTWAYKATFGTAKPFPKTTAWSCPLDYNFSFSRPEPETHHHPPPHPTRKPSTASPSSNGSAPPIPAFASASTTTPAAAPTANATAHTALPNAPQRSYTLKNTLDIRDVLFYSSRMEDKIGTKYGRDTISLKVLGIDKLGYRRPFLTKQVKNAYKVKSLLVHPDKNPHPQSKEAFQIVNKARQTLLKP